MKVRGGGAQLNGVAQVCQLDHWLGRHMFHHDVLRLRVQEYNPLEHCSVTTKLTEIQLMLFGALLTFVSRLMCKAPLKRCEKTPNSLLVSKY